jgi:HAD superfamily hydrolase (TIGR01549 family)
MVEAPRNFVLFDFDGVIADSHALSYELSRHFSPELDEKSYRALYEYNVFESLKKLSSWRDTLPEEYQRMFDPRMKDEIALVAGMDAVIRKVHESYRLAIISSTSQSGITYFLNKHRLISHFSDILGRDSHHSKVEKMAMVFEKYGVTSEQCVYITDTLGDMREAQAHGMGTIASSWGVHPRETLERGVPFRILNSPAELPDAVDDYFARAII